MSPPLSQPPPTPTPTLHYLHTLRHTTLNLTSLCHHPLRSHILTADPLRLRVWSVRRPLFSRDLPPKSPTVTALAVDVRRDMYFALYGGGRPTDVPPEGPDGASSAGGGDGSASVKKENLNIRPYDVGTIELLSSTLLTLGTFLPHSPSPSTRCTSMSFLPMSRGSVDVIVTAGRDAKVKVWGVGFVEEDEEDEEDHRENGDDSATTNDMSQAGGLSPLDPYDLHDGGVVAPDNNSCNNDVSYTTGSVVYPPPSLYRSTLTTSGTSRYVPVRPLRVRRPPPSKSASAKAAHNNPDPYRDDPKRRRDKERTATVSFLKEVTELQQYHNSIHTKVLIVPDSSVGSGGGGAGGPPTTTFVTSANNSLQFYTVRPDVSCCGGYPVVLPAFFVPSLLPHRSVLRSMRFVGCGGGGGGTTEGGGGGRAGGRDGEGDGDKGDNDDDNDDNNDNINDDSDSDSPSGLLITGDSTGFTRVYSTSPWPLPHGSGPSSSPVGSERDLHLLSSFKAHDNTRGGGGVAGIEVDCPEVPGPSADDDDHHHHGHNHHQRLAYDYFGGTRTFTTLGYDGVRQWVLRPNSLASSKTSPSPSSSSPSSLPLLPLCLSFLPLPSPPPSHSSHHAGPAKRNG